MAVLFYFLFLEKIVLVLDYSCERNVEAGKNILVGLWKKKSCFILFYFFQKEKVVLILDN